MAQRVLFTYKNPDSTENLNSRFARIIANGPYSGLLCKATATPSLFIDITAGDALTIEGVKIEESTDILSAVEIAPGHATRSRIDLICLYHKYVQGETIPQGNYASYVVIQGQVPSDDITAPVAPALPSIYHMPLCEVHVPAGALFITDTMLRNMTRVPTTMGLADYMAEAMYYAWGNFAYYGWDVTQLGETNLNVSPGKGLLCGRVNTSESDAIVTGLRFSSYLRPAADPHTAELYQVGQNLTLLEQPDFPTRLAITITTTTASVAGKIYVTGENELRNQIVDHEVLVSQAANETKTYFTDAYFAEVYLEGIDAGELVNPGHNTYIKIQDAPINLILAVGTPTGIPIFRTELNPAYKPKCNEMILAKAHTDEDSIILLEDLVINPLAEWEDNFTPMCDGVRKTFYASANAVPDTDSLWLDGTRLFHDPTDLWTETHGKGYKVAGREVVLGPSVPAPDSNTILRYRYKRLG